MRLAAGTMELSAHSETQSSIPFPKPLVASLNWPQRFFQLLARPRWVCGKYLLSLLHSVFSPKPLCTQAGPPNVIPPIPDAFVNKEYFCIVQMIQL